MIRIMILPEIILPIGSTVVGQRQDGYRLTHGTIVEKGDHNHHDQSYIT